MGGCLVLFMVMIALSPAAAWSFDPSDPLMRVGAGSGAADAGLKGGEGPRSSPAADLERTKSREELFMEVFKHPPPSVPLEMTLPLFVQGNPCGQTRAVLQADGTDLRLPFAFVIPCLGEIVKPEVIDALGATADPSGMISTAALEDAGLVVVFDKRRLCVSITVPDDLMGTRVHRLSGVRPGPDPSSAMKPSPLSGFVTVNARQRWSYPQESVDTDGHRGALAADFDSAVHLEGVVLEGAVSFLEEQARPLKRGDVRLVYDDPGDLLRYSAGDLRYPVVGYQSTIPMAGLGVSRDFSLKPHVVAYPVRQFEFYLDTPSKVEVWVNDALTGTLNLDAGMHDIRDFPFSSGQNDVRIVITDIYGRTQELAFSFIQETTLLAEGFSQFSCNVGVPRVTSAESIVYEEDEAAFSLFYRRGLSDVFTSGAYVQGIRDRGLMGAVGTWATGAGVVNLDAALGFARHRDRGIAGKLAFVHRPRPTSTSPAVSLQLEAEYVGSGFCRPMDLFGNDGNDLRLAGYVAVPLALGFSSSLGAGYTFTGGKDARDRYELSAGLRRLWFNKKVSTSLAVQGLRDVDGGHEKRVFFGLVWMFPDEKQSVSAGMASGGSHDLQWDYGPASSSPGNVHAQVKVGRRSEQESLRAKAGYVGNCGVVEVSQEVIHPSDPSQADVLNETTLSLGSSLVYVDGYWALSRPVNQGFVLVKGVKNLEGVQVAVNPGPEGCQAVSSTYMPGVLPTLSPYNIRNLRVEPVDPPEGFLPERTSYTLFPTYKSGYAITVGSDPTVIVVGVQRDRETGEPLGHQVIEVRRVPQGDGQPVRTFTSRSGRFQLIGLTPGSYEITPTDPSCRGSAVIVIPDGVQGVFDAGTVTLPGPS
ncbi:MAG TPA: hypothetical protein PLS81_11965 [Deltaproteobacteria bacterium]|nr:hypothetical protein [Deltaproteobacteria bacterium]